MRQLDPLVRSYSVTHPTGDVRLPTQPGWDQIIYAQTGLLVARTEHESWTIPSHRALCVGDGTRIRLVTRRPTAVRCLYLRTELGALAGPVRVINLTALAKELLLHAVEICPLRLDRPEDSALITLLVHQLSLHPTAALRLPMPVDDRARALAELLLADPAVTLATAIAGVAASRRTLERRFRSETNMTLAAWQRRARVLAAIELMLASQSVTAVAATVGYATPSSFVAAFRAELGQTPRAFVNPSTSAPDPTDKRTGS